jgi:hypothetical protein
MAIAISLSCAVLIFCSEQISLRSKRVATLGLGIDILGVLLVAAPIVRPFRQLTSEGTQNLSQYGHHKTTAIVSYQEGLTLPMQVGVFLIGLGFVFQLVAIWI